MRRPLLASALLAALTLPVTPLAAQDSWPPVSEARLRADVERLRAQRLRELRDAEKDARLPR